MDFLNDRDIAKLGDIFPPNDVYRPEKKRQSLCPTKSRPASYGIHHAAEMGGLAYLWLGLPANNVLAGVNDV
jgi:hypothetical protein